MARGIRAIVLNMDEECAIELRTKLLAIEGLKIVAELDEPALFESAIKQFPAELVVINLDPDPEGLIQFGSQIAEQYPDLTLFAISASDNPQLILQAMRSGFREFLLQPIELEHLIEAVNRITKQGGSQKETGKLICTLGTAGGCGATTFAVNLACELAQASKRSAVIVDLDLYFGHVATLLDLNPQFSVADLCQTLDSVDASMIEKALLKHESGLYVLARPTQFGQAQQISMANVATVLNALCEMFDYVICDGPTRNDTIRPGLLDLADTAFFLLTLTVPAVRNLDRINQELARQGYNLDRTKLIVSRYMGDSSTLSIDDVEQTLGRKVVGILPEDSRTMTAAINAGQTLSKFAPKSKLREAIRNLAQGLHDPQATQAVDKGGLFARVFGK